MGIEYLDPNNVLFQKTEGGFLSLKIGRRKPYRRIHLYRVFPLSDPSRLISVRDEDDNEIGIIESLSGFSKEAVALIQEELDRRYFSPSIQTLISLKEEFGYTYWEAETDAGVRRFTVKGGGSNVVHISDSELMVIDVDGNRFAFPDFEEVDAKHMKIIDTLL